MKDKYTDFNKKRMEIFRELVTRYWNGCLTSNHDLDVLADELIKKLEFEEADQTFVKDHIRIAMGLDPNNKDNFDDELLKVKGGMDIERPIISKLEEPCRYCEEENCECMLQNRYESSKYLRKHKKELLDERCTGCGGCVDRCDFGAIADKIEFIPVIELLKDKHTKVFASVAPAIAGQFGEQVSLGKLRTAFKLLGFEDMIETAMFADILTIKEAFEFSHLVVSKQDFFLTSCCCPIWFNTIRNNYPEIYNHLSPSVSPMIASGRIIKKLYDGAKVVFVAPCIAKKSEAKEKGLEGAIDYVLNFTELNEIFDALGIKLEELEEYDKDQASYGGRIYARTGGVSFSVKSVVNRIDPNRVVKMKSKRVDGVRECRKILDSLSKGQEFDANFIEGMGCCGGCVGGPKTNMDAVSAARLVNEFAEESFILTPLDNLNVVKILGQFGITSIEEIMMNEEMREILSRQ